MIWFPSPYIIFQVKDFGGAVKSFELSEFIDGIPLLSLTGFCRASQSDFRRLIKQKGLRINDRIVTDPNYIITFADFDDGSDFIWITSGKKNKHGVFLIMTEAPITGDELVWYTGGTWY